jgi:hypothetical protein
MLHFEEEDHEPVAVVRTLSDFALALTLIVLMLIGTRSAAGNKTMAETRATAASVQGTTSELTLLLTQSGQLTVVGKGGGGARLSAASLAEQWRTSHPARRATIVLVFPQETLATALHHALLDLQTAFGTNVARIDTVPKL